jgi:chromosome segregation ATPase
MARTSAFALHAVVLLAILPRPVHADAATEAKLRDALRSTTTQLRALEDERAAWQAREAAMKKELEELRAQPKAPPRNRAAERELEEAKSRAAEQARASALLTASLERCEAGKADASRTGDQDRARMGAEAAKLSERLAAAEVKNERIYGVAKEIIDWLEREGVGSETFLGLERVKLENAAQDHMDKLIDQRVKPLGAP